MFTNRRFFISLQELTLDRVLWVKWWMWIVFRALHLLSHDRLHGSFQTAPGIFLDKSLVLDVIIHAVGIKYKEEACNNHLQIEKPIDNHLDRLTVHIQLSEVNIFQVVNQDQHHCVKWNRKCKEHYRCDEVDIEPAESFFPLVNRCWLLTYYAVG